MGNCNNCGDRKDDANVSLEELQGAYVEEQGFQTLPNISFLTNTNYRIQLEVKTWQKESYSLFDYENKTHVKDTMIQVNEDGFLVSRNQDILWQNGTSLKRSESDVVLMQLEKTLDTFQLINLRYFRPNTFQETNNNEEIIRQELSTLRQNEVQQQIEIEEVSNFPCDKNVSMNESIINLERCIEYPSSATKQMRTRLSEKGKKMWLVVRSVQQYSAHQGLKIVEGDTFKLGRVKLIVKEIQLVNYSQNSQIENQIISNSSQVSIANANDPDANLCRVCLSVSNHSQNPLVNPCKCTGSTKYIHLQCLQMWLRSKLHSRCSDDCTVLLWKNLECELCKFIYPPIFKSDGNTYDLIELSKPKDQPYMLLDFHQKKFQEKGQKEIYENSNGIYIVFFGRKKLLRIGRAHDLEVNINDISVSRSHATFKQVYKYVDYQVGNEVYIQDKKSKFGTLVLMQKNVTLIPDLSGLEVQIGRNLIEFQMPQKGPADRTIFEKILGRNSFG